MNIGQLKLEIDRLLKAGFSSETPVRIYHPDSTTLLGLLGTELNYCEGRSNQVYDHAHSQGEYRNKFIVLSSRGPIPK